MSKKIINLNLATSDINGIIRELNAYKQDLQNKINIYRKRIATELATQASLRFSNSIVSDVIKGGASRKAEVVVSISEIGSTTIVMANGDDAIWCEFGAGVYHNGSVGSSPHPKGTELGFTIGSYGKGYGKGKAWGYYDNGSLVITRGTPATMPMYNAMIEVMRKALAIAQEVFV